MEDEEIEENHTPRASSPWIAATVTSMVIAMVAAAGMAWLNDQLLTTVAAEATHTEENFSRLTSRITALEAQTASLAQAPRPEPVPVDALNASIATTSNKLGELTNRLDTLEKKQARVATPVASIKVETVAPVAAPLSDEALRAQLVTILANLPKPASPGAPDATFIEKINDRFVGFVAIKKQAAHDPYETLRAHVTTDDVATLKNEINEMSEGDRKPFNTWLISYRDRALPSPASKKGH